MHLLQFSTSHYCRKARLVLGYKRLAYSVENLTPGLHALKLKPLTGLTTVPVLLPQLPDAPAAIADSTAIWRYLDRYQREPAIALPDRERQQQAELLEDWLDESIGPATRFVYYDYRAKDGKAIDPSLLSQAVIAIVRRQYRINAATVALARERLAMAFEVLTPWQKQPFLLGGDRPSIADLSAAALLSPLALLPHYREPYPWLFERIAALHDLCSEPRPPGLVTSASP